MFVLHCYSFFFLPSIAEDGKNTSTELKYHILVATTENGNKTFCEHKKDENEMDKKTERQAIIYYSWFFFYDFSRKCKLGERSLVSVDLRGG